MPELPGRFAQKSIPEGRRRAAGGLNTERPDDATDHGEEKDMSGYDRNAEAAVDPTAKAAPNRRVHLAAHTPDSDDETRPPAGVGVLRLVRLAVPGAPVVPVAVVRLGERLTLTDRALIPSDATMGCWAIADGPGELGGEAPGIPPPPIKPPDAAASAPSSIPAFSPIPEFSSPSLPRCLICSA